MENAHISLKRANYRMSNDLSVKKRHLKISYNSQKSTQSTALLVPDNHQHFIQNQARFSLPNWPLGEHLQCTNYSTFSSVHDVLSQKAWHTKGKQRPRVDVTCPSPCMSEYNVQGPFMSARLSAPSLGPVWGSAIMGLNMYFCWGTERLIFQFPAHDLAQSLRANKTSQQLPGSAKTEGSTVSCQVSQIAFFYKNLQSSCVPSAVTSTALSV